ncbi:MAG: 7TM diverse intracellular signaling domain-containing protein [Oligoflexus sp.]
MLQLKGSFVKKLEEFKLFALVLAAVFGSSQAMATETLVDQPVLEVYSDQNLEGLPLVHVMQRLNDKSMELNINDISSDPWQKDFATIHDEGTTTFGAGNFWYRLRISFYGDAPRRVLFRHELAYTDHVTLFTKSEMQNAFLSSKTLGDKRPFTDRLFPYRTPVFAVELEPGYNDFYFLINTHGPINGKFTLWEPTRFQSFMRGEYAFIGVLLGFVLVMIGYNGLLAIRFNNPSYFIYVGYITCFMLVQLIFMGFFQEFVSPTSRHNWMTNEGLVVAAESTAIFGAWFALSFLAIKRKMPWIYRGILLFFVLSTINIVITQIDSNIGVAFVLLTNGLVSFLLLTAGIIGCIARFRPAYFYTAAWGCIIIGSLITMARIYGFLPDHPVTVWGQFVGGCLEVVLLSLALGDKMRLQQERAHQKISELADDLQDANKELKKHIESVELIVDEKTRDIKSILKNIKQGIFTISAQDGRIMPEYSNFLEEIFDTKIISGQDPCDLLFASSNIDENLMDQTKSVLQSCLGNHPLNFDANRDLLVRDLKVPTRKLAVSNLDQLEVNLTSEKILQIDWDAIEYNDEIDKILVTVRDVSELRKLEASQEKQRKELAAIGQILAISPEKFTRMVSHCHDFYESCYQLLQSEKRLQRKSIEIIYMNIHTMKGIMRSFHFADMANSLHQVEEILDQIKQDKVEVLDSEFLRQKIRGSHEMLDEYVRINDEKLGRKQGRDSHKLRVDWIRGKVKNLRDLDPSGMNGIQRETIISMIQEMEELSARNLEETLESVLEGLPASANSLGKAPPYIIIEEDGRRLTAEGQHLVENIFIHLFTNAIDHGIEAAEVRKIAGKSRRGEISVKAQSEGEDLLIIVQDDGKGLNINEISKRAGLARRLSAPEIVEALFDPGFSTKDSASLHSGRGFGLGAVKTYLANEGSSIWIDFLDDPSKAEFCRFRWEMRLASHLLLPKREKTTIEAGEETKPFQQAKTS